MVGISNNNWKAIAGLVSELKRCEECGVTTASIAMAYICIDTLANLARPADKEKVTRADFTEWVEKYLKAHNDQPYHYRGKDVYAARCAFLHTYGSDAQLHDEDPDTMKFGYHDGGKHECKPDTDLCLVLIGTKSFVNDVVIGTESFLHECQKDQALRERVEARLPKVLQTLPYPAE
ncbi:hypothetical protein [Algiphilus aromaticivorans]|jgi:hypothetical protein|uniref:hypothetical protein n=1 Tax=Algiphilus aromaticivorans TaxID=382454 RepID=UPI0009FF3340|nr:hypothetical protein [Algiphilus aromaticivorans]